MLSGAVLSAMRNKYSQVDMILKDKEEKDEGIHKCHRRIVLMRFKLKGERVLGFKDGRNSVFAAPTSPLTSYLNGQMGNVLFIIMLLSLRVSFMIKLKHFDNHLPRTVENIGD